jgi:hypothetical protein
VCYRWTDGQHNWGGQKEKNNTIQRHFDRLLILRIPTAGSFSSFFCFASFVTQRKHRYSGLTCQITAAAAMLNNTTPIAVDTIVICYHTTHQLTNRPKTKNKRHTASYGTCFPTTCSLSSTFVIKLSSEPVTAELIHANEVTGARWTLDSGVSS